MKAGLLRRRGVGIAIAETIQDGMRCFVSNDVVREAAENPLSA
jgi:hypothetical protein